MTTPGDILAATDLLSELIEESDTLAVDDAIQMIEVVSLLSSEARRTIDLLTAHLHKVMEKGGRELAGRRYTTSPRTKQTYDHDTIAAKVIHRALKPDENGELPPARDAVNFAVTLMRDLYVSDSTKAKVGVLKGDVLELDVEDLRDTVPTGTYEVKVKDPTTNKDLKLGEVI